MINIGICDDDINELEHLRERIEAWGYSHKTTVQVSTFSSAEALLSAVHSSDGFDLYILDVIMPNLDGIELGKRLRQERDGCGEVPIIYLSSSRDFAANSYEVHAFYYLLKPASDAQFEEVLSSAIAQIAQSKSRLLPIRTKTGTFSVAYDEICYVILENRCLTYLCLDRSITSTTIPGSFKSATAQLAAQPQFFLCGASMLVNLERIKSIEKSDVNFANDATLSVPRSTATPLYKAWLDFWLD